MAVRRSYKVGGIVFSVELDAPWTFMNYIPAVAQRIAAARRGELLELLPTRAGDEVPARTYVTAKSELPEDYNPTTLDFSQYEPFLEEGSADSGFSLTVKAPGLPDWAACLNESPDAKLLMAIDDSAPSYFVYKRSSDTVFIFEGSTPGKIVGALVVPEGHTRGEYYCAEGTRPYALMMSVSMALMMMYTYVSASSNALLMHASVIRHKGMANLFLGTSGTGKSTHSRLWLGNIEGAELMNDDNPVLRVEDGQVYVYGTPWSGKTPCYRNVREQVRAIVHLTQAPVNEATKLGGIQNYANIISSASSIRWDRPIMDGVTSTASTIAMNSSGWSLKCLPDADAARVCCEAIEG